MKHGNGTDDLRLSGNRAGLLLDLSTVHLRGGIKRRVL
jgi:hypothetical protein